MGIFDKLESNLQDLSKFDPFNTSKTSSGVTPSNKRYDSGINLKYPLDDEIDYKGKIIFQVVEQEPVTLEILGTYFGNISNLLETDRVRGSLGLTDEQQMDLEFAQAEAQFAQLDETESKKNGPTETLGRKVTLFLPQAIQITTGANYTNVDLGAIGATAEAELRGGVDVLGAAVTGASRLVGSTIDAIKSGLKTDQAQVAATRISALGGEGIQGAVKSLTRVGSNPNTRSIFQNVPLREFSFTFKFIAQSVDEAEEIKAIIKTFRAEMLPKKIPASDEKLKNVAIGYKFPNKFDIKFKYDGEDVATKLKRCYLRNCNVTYNASSMGMHEDGNFTEIDMTLAFVEERAISREDVEEGEY